MAKPKDGIRDIHFRYDAELKGKLITLTQHFSERNPVIIRRAIAELYRSLTADHVQKRIPTEQVRLSKDSETTFRSDVNLDSKLTNLIACCGQNQSVIIRRAIIELYDRTFPGKTSI